MVTKNAVFMRSVAFRKRLDVKVEGGAYGLKITKLGIFKDNLGKVHASVCSECGYLEFYLEDTAKIKK